MKKTILSVFIATVLVAIEAKSQVLIDTVALIAVEETTTEFCFNNTKLMAGNSISDRYLIYYNPDTIFVNVYQSGNWTRNIVSTGSSIKSATLSFYKDTIWVCWKDGAFIKASYSTLPNIGTSWTGIPNVSPAGNVAAPSIYASANGKIHFVWSTESSTDSTIFHKL